MNYDFASARNTARAKQIWMLSGGQNGGLDQLAHTARRRRVVFGDMEDDGCETIVRRYTPEYWQRH
ncbi:MAG: hypothetical protein WDM70_00885 [Nitrosomonadales bacterium]